MKKIDRLECKCLILEKQKEAIMQDLRETNVNIEPELNMGISYSSERVQTSSSGTSYAEAEIMKQIEKLEREWKWTRRKILQLHSQIREIKRQNADMDYIIGRLGTEYRLLVEMKYRDCLSLEKIGDKLCMAKSTVSRNRERIVEDISKIESL